MNRSETEEFARFLEKSYGKVEFLETHISFILLTPAEAWKIKKPVRTSFLDFSSLEKRKFFCLEELKQNRRFSPEIYLGVREIRKQDQQIVSLENARGTIMDYAVVSKRLPDNRHMSRILEKGEVTKGEIVALAGAVTEIHRNCPVVHAPFNEEKWNRQVHDIRSTRGIIMEAEGTSGNLLDKALYVSDKFIARNLKLLDQRRKNGCFRDCHGDLHSGNIFLTSPPVIFDCIEFDEDLRRIDLLYETAFLLMDLDFYEKTRLGVLFLNNYPFFRLDDRHLLTYYKLCRALIRLKVAALLPGASEDPVIREKMNRYLRLVETYVSLLESSDML